MKCDTILETVTLQKKYLVSGGPKVVKFISSSVEVPLKSSHR